MGRSYKVIKYFDEFWARPSVARTNAAVIHLNGMLGLYLVTYGWKARKVR